MTHPRIYDPNASRNGHRSDRRVLESPTLLLLSESVEHWDQIRPLLIGGKIAGPRVHDARIAALCLAHGVRELWTADRDFGRFPALPTRNPLTEEIDPIR